MPGGSGDYKNLNTASGKRLSCRGFSAPLQPPLPLRRKKFRDLAAHWRPVEGCYC